MPIPICSPISSRSVLGVYPQIEGLDEDRNACRTMIHWLQHLRQREQAEQQHCTLRARLQCMQDKVAIEMPAGETAREHDRPLVLTEKLFPQQTRSVCRTHRFSPYHSVVATLPML